MLQALQDLTKRLAESGEYESELSLWGDLLLPEGPAELIDGTFDMREPDVSRSQFHTLPGDIAVSIIVAQGNKARKRLPLAHAAATAVQMKGGLD